jgi:hypothetical protein
VTPCHSWKNAPFGGPYRLHHHIENIRELGSTLEITSNWSTPQRNTNYMERISELGTTLAVTSNWSTLRRNTNYMERIGELGSTLAITSNWSTLRRNTNYMERIGELGSTLAITSKWSILRRNTNYMERISELGSTLAVTSNWSTLPLLAPQCCMYRQAVLIIPGSFIWRQVINKLETLVFFVGIDFVYTLGCLNWWPVRNCRFLSPLCLFSAITGRHKGVNWVLWMGLLRTVI